MQNMKTKTIFLRSISLFFRPLIFTLALFLVFEEWLWDSLKAQIARLGQLPFFALLETRLKGLSPWASLAILVAPALVLLPFKILALWALAHHHAALGITIIVAAKLTGTAVAAYLFDLVRDNARKLPWFDRLYTRVIGMFHRAKEWLHKQNAYIATKRAVGLIRVRVVGILKRSAGRKSRFERRLRAAKKGLGADKGI
jgi:hypothetical protein